MEERVRLVQCLCGPKRHAIFAMAYEPGMMMGDIEMTDDTASEFLKGVVETMLLQREIGSKCGLCDARADDSWYYEDAPTKYRTMTEAEPHLREHQLKNLAALVRMRAHRAEHEN